MLPISRTTTFASATPVTYHATLDPVALPANETPQPPDTVAELPTKSAGSTVNGRAADALLAQGISDPSLLVSAYLRDAASAYGSDGRV